MGASGGGARVMQVWCEAGSRACALLSQVWREWGGRPQQVSREATAAPRSGQLRLRVGGALDGEPGRRKKHAAETKGVEGRRMAKKGRERGERKREAQE